MFDRRERRCPCTAIVASDDQVIGLGFSDASRDGANANLRTQLDADSGFRVGILQVMDQLSDILDRINIVVRRWANQANARR